MLYRGSMQQGGAIQDCLLCFSMNNSLWLSDECQSRKKTPLITTSNINYPPNQATQAWRSASNALWIMQKERRMWIRLNTSLTLCTFLSAFPLFNIYTLAQVTIETPALKNMLILLGQKKAVKAKLAVKTNSKYSNWDDDEAHKWHFSLHLPLFFFPRVTSVRHQSNKAKVEVPFRVKTYQQVESTSAKHRGDNKSFHWMQSLVVTVTDSAAQWHVKHEATLFHCGGSLMTTYYMSFSFFYPHCLATSTHHLCWVTAAKLGPSPEPSLPLSHCIKAWLILSDANGSQWRPWGARANVLRQLTSYLLAVTLGRCELMCACSLPLLWPDVGVL